MWTHGPVHWTLTGSWRPQLVPSLRECRGASGGLLRARTALRGSWRCCQVGSRRASPSVRRSVDTLPAPRPARHFEHPSVDNPLDLTGGDSPNLSTHGIELTPLLVSRPNGERYTKAQYKSLGVLLAFLRSRAFGEYFTVGHESTNPLRRWYTPKQAPNVKYPGGWDPGALSARPRFRWENVPDLPNHLILEPEEITNRFRFAVGCFLRKFWR